MRDVVEVLKWTIAIGVIYGPIRKLGEMLTEMKQIQLAMVDVQIVLGNSTEKMNIAFEASARVATETSSTLLGVIQGYSLAAGAAASAGNDFERLAATESLLKNSMILAKLAGTDQKASLDTLVGAISQAGLKLTEGTKLLDSWVAVSKKSNVSVNQMATTFSIVGSAAQEVGLSFDQLNGLVGAMGQATNLSADEIGNAIRGIIAAMQTDKASAEFAKYGIATKTLSGDMRDLMEIFREIKVMQQTGILDDKAMGALMEAGGAGARRGAQLSALVKNLGLVMDLTTVSQNANGDAAKAMALEMETLDAATTRLGNAFTELAKTLGTEGGILDFLTLATKGAASLVKGIRDLVSVMKWAAPVFATFMLAKGVSGTSTGINLLSNVLPKVMQSVLSTQAFGGLTTAAQTSMVMTPEIKRLMQVAGTKSTTTPVNELTYGALFGSIGKKLMQPMFPQTEAVAQMGTLGIGTKVATSISGVFGKMNWASLIGPAVVAATNIGKPKEEGIPRAIAGGLGAIPGILSGNPIWATIGSVIATGFYDKFLTLKGDIAAELAQWVSVNPQKPLTAEEAAKPQTWTSTLLTDIKTTLEGPPPPPETTLPSALPTTDEALKNLETAMLKNMGYVEKFSVSTMQMSRLTKEQKEAGLGDILGSQGMTMLAMYLAQKQGKTVTGQEIGWSGKGLNLNYTPAPLSQETMDAFDKYVNMFLIKGVEEGFVSTTVETAKTAEIQALSGLVATASADLMEKAIKDIAAGATNGITNLNNAQQIVNTLATSAGTLIEAQQQTPGMPAITGPEAINLMTNLTPDEADQLNTAVSDITNGLSALEIAQATINAEKEKGVQVDQKYLDQETALTEQIAKGRERLVQLYPALKQVSLARQAEAMMKPEVEVPEGITAEQLQKAVTAAEQMWNDYLESQNIPPDMLEAWKAQQVESILVAKDEVFSITTKVPSKFLNLQFEKQGLTGPGTQINQNYTDITKAQMAGRMQQYQPLKQQLELLGYKSNEEQLLIQNKDGWSLEHADSTILQLLMNDLIDETKKNGLQGIYNLPEGATFMVPVTAYEMSKATTTEMAGGGTSLAGVADIIAQLTQLASTLNLQANPPQEINPNAPGAIENLGAVEPGKGFTFGENEYKMFGPPTPETNIFASITAGNPLPVMVTNMVEGFKADILGTTNKPYDERGAAIQEAIPTPAVPLVQQNLNPVQPEFWTLIGDIFKTFWEQGVQPVLQGQNQTAVPPITAVPEIKLPAQMMNWFSQQSLMTTPVSATSALQVQDQKSISTALNLSVDSKIVLTVDGRTLATIIKPYLYEDLIRFGTGTTSSTSRSVIA
jgi:TP901 family phage tail tape measure protein